MVRGTSRPRGGFAQFFVRPGEEGGSAASAGSGPSALGALPAPAAPPDPGAAAALAEAQGLTDAMGQLNHARGGWIRGGGAGERGDGRLARVEDVRLAGAGALAGAGVPPGPAAAAAGAPFTHQAGTRQAARSKSVQTVTGRVLAADSGDSGVGGPPSSKDVNVWAEGLPTNRACAIGDPPDSNGSELPVLGAGPAESTPPSSGGRARCVPTDPHVPNANGVGAGGDAAARGDQRRLGGAGAPESVALDAEADPTTLRERAQWASDRLLGRAPRVDSGTWEGAPGSAPAIRGGGTGDDKGGPGDTPVSVRWLREGPPGRALERERDAREGIGAHGAERWAPYREAKRELDETVARRLDPGTGVLRAEDRRFDPVAREGRSDHDSGASSVARLEPPLSPAGSDPVHRGSVAHLSDWERWLELCARIDGFPRHLSIHSGGMLVTAAPLIDIAPIERATMQDRVVVQYDKRDVETMKLIKLDLLGLGMLAAIDETVQLVQHDCAVCLDLDRTPEEIPVVFAMLQAADTVGVFQVESRAQMQTLPTSRPQTSTTWWWRWRSSARGPSRATRCTRTCGASRASSRWPTCTRRSSPSSTTPWGGLAVGPLRRRRLIDQRLEPERRLRGALPRPAWGFCCCLERWPRLGLSRSRNRLYQAMPAEKNIVPTTPRIHA